MTIYLSKEELKDCLRRVKKYCSDGIEIEIQEGNYKSFKARNIEEVSK